MTNLSDQPVSGRGNDPRVAAQVGQLYRSHGALVRAVCRSLLRDRFEAEDAVQQTFLSAHRALLRGSSPREAPAWLAAIARNESLRLMQARMRQPLSVDISELGAAPDAYAAVLQRQGANELRDALAELPNRQRDAILLRELRGFTSKEVGVALSVSAYAAESLAFRARQSLRRRLRGGLTALTPGPLLPLRVLAARLGSGLGASAAAKVAAVGVGTVLVTGGVLFGPRAPWFGHVSRPSRVAAPSRAERTANAAATWSSVASSPSFVRDSGDMTSDADSARHAPDNDSVSVGHPRWHEPSSKLSADVSQTSAGNDNSQDETKHSRGAGNQQQDGAQSGDSQSGASSSSSTDSGNSQGGNGQGD